MAKPLPQFSEAPPRATDEQLRKRFYRAVSNAVREVMEGRTKYSAESGKAAIEAVTELIFNQATQEGYFRFPLGYGSLRVHRLRLDPMPKRLPTGETIALPPGRVKLRYEEGAAVREALGMPSHTNYKRQFHRRSKLSKKSLALLNSPV